MAVEAKLQGRNSVSIDINPYAIELTKKKNRLLTKEGIIWAYAELIKDLEKTKQKENGNGSYLAAIDKEIEKYQKIKKSFEEGDYKETEHKAYRSDARKLKWDDEKFDAIITDIPYGDMVRYSDQKADLSTLEDYESFITEIEKAFDEMIRVLKKGKYLVVLVADNRIGASRQIIPIHSDLIQIFQKKGLTLFDLYIWRYYRSGGFRPFGKRPFQAMNIHSYILVFYKPLGTESFDKQNKRYKYRKKLKEKFDRSKEKSESLCAQKDLSL